MARLGGRRRRVALAAAVAVLIGAVVSAIVLVGRDATRVIVAPTLADAVPSDGRSPREPAGDEQRVLVELGRPALGTLPDLAGLDAGERSAYVASLRRERQALRGALAARGVRLREVVGFERTWNGFAATVRTRDLAAISSLGVRAQPVRRFYPSVGEPVPLEGPRPGPVAPGGPPVALLAAGVRGGDPGLEAGYDAVDGDRAPTPGTDPRDPRRRETSGTTLAGVLLRAGRRVRPIRIAALRTPTAGAVAGASEYATTDTLLTGLERTVDPDGDGDPEDAASVALVGVHAPYAGFPDAPEAEAADAAAALGTLVVAPAGHEGPARPPSGTVGSPAAAARAVAVGALAARAPAVELRAPGLRVGSAAALGGAPPRQALRRVPSEASRPDTPQPGGIAVLRAGRYPSAQAAEAAAQGARAVLLAEPRVRRPLPAVPAGRVPVPVMGVTGAAARAVLALPRGARIGFGRPRLGGAPTAGGGVSRFASRGPALDGSTKPDMAAPGSAPTVGPAGRPAAAGGAGPAAALVAAEAARLAARQPALSPRQLERALIGVADPGGRESVALPSEAAGAGALRRARAGAPVRAPVVSPAPPPAPAVAVGPLVLTRDGGEVTGARFTVGAFDRGDPLTAGVAFQPVERLELELVQGRSTVARRLTPSGGARQLLPAEYAYTLDARTRRGLPRDRPLRFRVRARAPRQAGRATTRTSEPFTRR